jgi:hypothetical protein
MDRVDVALRGAESDLDKMGGKRGKKKCGCFGESLDHTVAQKSLLSGLFQISKT